MNVVETAREQVKHLVEKVSEKVSESVSFDSKVQAVTIPRPRRDVVEFFSDPDCLAEIFGDIADVESTGPGRFTWTFVLEGHDGPSWDCVVKQEDDTELSFVDARPNASADIALHFRDAPQDRGTEVIAKISSPAPGALTGLLAFKALYRARALLVTGEIPTIKYNPSARPSDR